MIITEFGIYIVALSLLIIAIALVPLFFRLRGTSFDIFDPRNMFAAYYALQLGVYSLYIVITGEDFKIIDAGDSTDMLWLLGALVVSAIGITTFHIGYFVASATARRPSFALGTRTLVQSRVVLLSYCAIPVVAYSIYSVYVARGGLSGYVDSFVDIRYSGTGIQGYLQYIGSGFLTILAILLYISSVGGPGRRMMRLAAWVLFMLATILTALTGYRALLAPVILAIAACYHYYSKRLSTVRALVFVVVLIGLMTAYGVVREYVESRSVQQDGGRPISPMEAVLLRSPGIELVANTMRRINEGQRYQYFLPGIWEAATILIPRALWPDKPTPQGLVYGERFMEYFLFLRDGTVNANTGGHSMTIIGYLYWQLGGLGVILGMFTTGALFGYVYQRFHSDTGNQRIGLLFLAVYGTLPKIAEAPQEAVNGLVIVLFFTLIIVAFCGAGWSGPRGRLEPERTTSIRPEQRPRGLVPVPFQRES